MIMLLIDISIFRGSPILPAGACLTKSLNVSGAGAGKSALKMLAKTFCHDMKHEARNKKHEDENEAPLKVKMKIPVKMKILLSKHFQRIILTSRHEDFTAVNHSDYSVTKFDSLILSHSSAISADTPTIGVTRVSPPCESSSNPCPESSYSPGQPGTLALGGTPLGCLLLHSRDWVTNINDLYGLLSLSGLVEDNLFNLTVCRSSFLILGPLGRVIDFTIVMGENLFIRLIVSHRRNNVGGTRTGGPLDSRLLSALTWLNDGGKLTSAWIVATKVITSLITHTAQTVLTSGVKEGMTTKLVKQLHLFQSKCLLIVSFTWLYESS